MREWIRKARCWLGLHNGEFIADSPKHSGYTLRTRMCTNCGKFEWYSK